MESRTVSQEDAGAKSSEGSSQNTMACLGVENQGFFDKMSEGAKKIANQAYDGLYKIPVVNRMVGKMEIAYGQFWVDRHESKAAALKSKMDVFDMQRAALDQSKSEMASIIENFKKQNVPGIESLQLKLKDIDQQKAGLLDKKDKLQTKAEARINKVKLHSNERDRIADRLIGDYDEKLAPMEKDLEQLQTCRDELDLSVAITEEKHEQQLERLENIEKKKTQIEESLKVAGTSDREIRKLVKPFEDQVAQGRERMRVEKEHLAKEKTEINKKIAKADAKANPYRDKREEFVRIKSGRPLEMRVGARTRGVEFKGQEETRAHPRVEATETEETTPIASETVQTETTGEKMERFKISELVDNWNIYLQDKYNAEARGVSVDPNDFLKVMRVRRILGDFKAGFVGFKKILEGYYKLKKLPTDKLAESFDKFVEGYKAKK